MTRRRPIDSYSRESIERLLGLQEGHGLKGERHVTFLDILSWLRDPGGDYTWQHLVQERLGVDVWMAVRGPLAPDSDLALLYWDFQRAMARLEVIEQVVVYLTIAGFNQEDIATVVGKHQSTVSRILLGSAKRGADGQVLRTEDGDIVYRGGISSKLARLMNGWDREEEGPEETAAAQADQGPAPPSDPRPSHPGLRRRPPRARPTGEVHGSKG